MTDTRDEVLAIFANELQVPVSAISDDTGFDDVDADSLDLIEIVMELEDAFKIEITDDEWHAVANVGEVLALVESKVGVSA